MTKEKKGLRRIRLGLWIAGAILIAFATKKLKLDYFEAFVYDLRLAYRPAPKTTGLIETIAIESTSVQKLKTVPSLAHHTLFLKNLLKSDPRAVIYIPGPDDLAGSNVDQKQFVEVAKQFRNFFFVTSELELDGEEGKFRLPGVFDELRMFSGPFATDKVNLAKDGVTRRLVLSYQGNLLLHPYLAAQIKPELAIPQNIQGHFTFFDTEQAYIDFLPKGSFPSTPFIQVMEGGFATDKSTEKSTEKSIERFTDKLTEKFKDKFVFVGMDLGQSPSDYILTPYSRDVMAMTVLETHANILDSILRNSSPTQAPEWLNFLFSLLIAVITFHVVMSLKPARGLAILGLTLVGFSIICYFAFWPFGLWIEMAHPLLTIFLSYYFLIPYRLIVENRKSWEYYQKNKLLTQVEELKTNFISMMSHDLKTPLARIQGMVELLMRDKNPLSPEQEKAAQTIKRSSEDLVKFINSIVNFSRIESQGVQLNLKSKDINSLVEDTVHKCDFLAAQKKIEIRTELEPIFSIKIDPDLISQVLANLIENAIKYSPEGAKVLVTTEENDQNIVIQISDQGQGIPSDEISSIFMKFYRSKDARASSTKGSGIGLYLAKYFVELHHGSIKVESSLGQGSTFTIELPINSKA